MLFVAPFVDPRRPFRLLHFDLLVLLSFGVAQLFFNKGDIDVWVPAVYPPRCTCSCACCCPASGRASVRRRWCRTRTIPGRGRLWLLALFRIVDVVDSAVIDVGYAGRRSRSDHARPATVRAQRDYGDTYGPFAYLTYIPFAS